MGSKYRYSVYTSAGNKLEGLISAESYESARQKIREQGNTILYLKEKRRLHFGVSAFSRKMSSRNVMLFFRQISVLLSSSMSLSDSLEFLSREERKPFLAKLYSEIHQKLCEGKRFSEIIRQHGALFPPAVTAVIVAGEKSGHMNDALEALAHFLEQRRKLREAILQATLYPIVLILVSLLVITALMTLAIPAIADQLLSSNVALPVSTAVLIACSQFISANYQSVSFAILVAILALRIGLRNTRTKQFLDSALLRMPVIGGIIKDGQNGMLLLTLNLLTRFSVPVLDAFTTARPVVTNLALRKRLEAVCESIHQGKGIANSLATVGLFDDTTMALLRAGEKSGQFQQMVQFSSELLSRETALRIAGIMKILEPALILWIGLIVLFVFMAIMQPLLNLNNVTF